MPPSQNTATTDIQNRQGDNSDQQEEEKKKFTNDITTNTEILLKNIQLEE